MLAAGLRALPAGCVLDCELVLPTASGVDFHGLTRACWPGRGQALVLVAFDALQARSKDVSVEPLGKCRQQRKVASLIACRRRTASWRFLVG